MPLRLSFAAAASLAALALAGCGAREAPEAQSIENQFEQRAAEIEERARLLEAQAENAAAGIEARLDAEFEALRNQAEQNRAEAGNEAEAANAAE
ncbi:MAG: hypothetical protein ACK4K7_14880 [Allosphingosinicella sp.]|uniref:hypothetical protein n=1 Tax=Allosphingosinicella sp. TaxID=2823234 RepID=UPI003957960E